MEAISLGAVVVTERGVDPTLDSLWADKVRRCCLPYESVVSQKRLILGLTVFQSPYRTATNPSPAVVSQCELG